MQGLARFAILPIIGWVISAFMAVVIALPLYFLWGWLGPVYFSFVPAVYLNMGFWDMAGLLILIGFFKLIVFPSTLNRSNTSKKEEKK